VGCLHGCLNQQLTNPLIVTIWGRISLAGLPRHDPQNLPILLELNVASRNILPGLSNVTQLKKGRQPVRRCRPSGARQDARHHQPRPRPAGRRTDEGCLRVPGWIAQRPLIRSDYATTCRVGFVLIHQFRQRRDRRVGLLDSAELRCEFLGLFQRIKRDGVTGLRSRSLFRCCLGSCRFILLGFQVELALKTLLRR
jgi:hypothetical protein